jgi:hypothetical protein
MSGAPPTLYFSDLTWGPKTGWEASSYKGAAVTVWGANLGSARGSNYVTANGAQLVLDTDYAEWGAVGPARELHRITFWLNSGCTEGSGAISVTVNGITSNALPFTVAAGTIYFISPAGDNGNNGLYSTPQSGNNGPFHDIYAFNPGLNPSGDGQYIVYAREGVYTTTDPAGESTFVSLRGPYGGPDRQKALVAYPGEAPTLDCDGLVRSAIWQADYAPYGRNSYFTYAKLTFKNGPEAVSIFGDYNRVIGNTFQSMLDPTWSGVVFVANSAHTAIYGNFFNHNGATADGAYKHQIYTICTNLVEDVSTEYTDIGWNEFADTESGSDNRGGVVFFRRATDAAPGTQARYWYLHDNYFHGGNQNFVEIGDGGLQSDVWIWNNIFVGGPTVNNVIAIRWTTTNANVYNNTLYLVGDNASALVGLEGNDPGTSVVSRNNIFYGFANQAFFSVDNSHGSLLTSDHDLFYSQGGDTRVISGPGIIVRNPVVGDPGYTDPARGDFHLQADSPARDAGSNTVRDVVKQDYDGYARPLDGTFDIGALQYVTR